MNIALWITTSLLTAVYLFSGFGKLLVPREKMAGMSDAARWVLDFKPGTLKAIGALEILGAVGLTLPAVLGIAPVLVPLAASGLAMIMTGAMIMRIRRGETGAALGDGGYLALTAFVAIGRFALEPFTG
ncbi:DoxX family protein [Allostreptomyces psammosilenae]|uniref:Putative membrane protein YphA (DoxX/SURF4 family) n=1 Tax=Allostreptomyces psammosilenae TaxID=1892865 RepID=A0A852ZVN5_9ACTN|nr:DoxX family protein [Allostreptomyces psammosilenae]NYI06453.1 putative membrane protein YphA (DoxX/SURF4 family) [Allostreptomyces psammosilenae]